ncbi:hypothetical protein DB30_03719 [Enhygromyxa salina]|uniref:Uncharacterized protein n=1 Tax=Enhygromyxa salina TaxID=215803 RepID=A0A0C2DBG6_9BACT|nr:hypothetical protein DB30_03719 [Enhygromyxa salina]
MSIAERTNRQFQRYLAMAPLNVNERIDPSLFFALVRN